MNHTPIITEPLGAPESQVPLTLGRPALPSRMSTPPDTAGVARRTFVISDAHGYPQFIESALEHGGFCPGVDAFIYAGDFLDRGPDGQGCLDLIERYATEVLLGNHELAILIGFPLFEQTPETRAYRQLIRERVFADDSATRWNMVSHLDGILVSHAGISESYRSVFEGECQDDPSRLATYLNEAFLANLRQVDSTYDWEDEGILGYDGPLWFRPQPYSNRLPLAGVTQVVGHTPPLLHLEAAGFFMVDPCVFQGVGDSPRYRYGLIENGRVQVAEGILDDGPVRFMMSPRGTRHTRALDVSRR